MKWFIIKILLFAVPVLVALTALELYARDNYFAKKKAYLDANKQQAEVLVLGSSHMHYGINPLEMQPTTVNMSLLASAPEVDYRVFEKFAPELPSLRYVLLDFSAAYIDKGTQEKWDGNVYLKTHWGVSKRQPELWDNFLSIAQFRKSLVQAADDLRGKHIPNYNPAGFETQIDPKINIVQRFGYSQDSLAGYKRYIHRMNRDHNQTHLENRAINRVYFERIKNYCIQHNIKLILVSVPKMRLYNDFMGKEVLDARNQLAADLVDNQHVIFWNDDRLFDDNTEYFFDLNHLDVNGAAEYSHIISQRLEALESKAE
ncbi:MAG: hypothetical protein Q4F57_06315 [Weeksellaceae bacterium]|nr:hypothetical protein [Weeksellaceae bacterium]